MQSTGTIRDTDRELASALMSGSRKAFEDLYARYAAVLLGFLVKIVPDRKVAEDILQASFIAIWEGRQSLGTQPLLGQLMAIARKTALTLKNSDPANRNPLSFVNTDNSLKTNGTPPGQEWLEKAVFELVYVNGCTINNVAASLGIEEKNIKPMLRKAMKTLKPSPHD
jgi:RNA polymerase sigma-70 factor (ECF subfamily)